MEGQSAEGLTRLGCFCSMYCDSMIRLWIHGRVHVCDCGRGRNEVLKRYREEGG